ncbi:hypothetical protein RIR_jg9436.t1 [Rhizophagus irregularis DAOM 181602=DAOM 197198]|nr:hypothetical protein RhiirB3_526686 [Rhizophagus irregularis]GET54712.1 hypothetical protein RIR_jg9436.t1 [Rhizophagus irregularis DAOM 181602=DAOM 197198]
MIVNHFNNWQFNESNTENVDVEEYIGLKQNNEENTNSLNIAFKIIQNFNNLLIFDIKENYNAFTKGKEALKKLMQNNEWKIVQ